MKVLWSVKARESVQDAANYALDKFGERQVRILREKIKSSANKISLMPTAYPLEQSLLDLDITYRYITLFPKLELVYHQEDEDTILIDIIWNTRRNPQTLQSTLGQ